MSTFTDKLTASVAEARTLQQIQNLSSIIWKAHGSDLVDGASAQALAEVLHAKKRAIGARAALASERRTRNRFHQPVTHEKLIRRRNWSASGQVPASIACHYTPGQQSVLAVIVSLLRSSTFVTKTLKELGDLAGVSRKTVQRCILLAKTLGHLHIQVRRISATRNLPHKISALDPSLKAWIDRKPVRWTINSMLKKQVLIQNIVDKSPLAAVPNQFLALRRRNFQNSSHFLA